jgi:hypothetical protein
MSCVRIAWPERSHCSADMVGMAMSENDEINMLSRSSGRRQRINQDSAARYSEVRTGTRVDEDEPTVCTNEEDIARARELSALVEYPSELALDLCQIRIRPNVETRRHREGACVKELPGHGASSTSHAASLGEPHHRRQTGGSGSFRNTGLARILSLRRCPDLRRAFWG